MHLLSVTSILEYGNDCSEVYNYKTHYICLVRIVVLERLIRAISRLLDLETSLVAVGALSSSRLFSLQLGWGWGFHSNLTSISMLYDLLSRPFFTKTCY